MKNKLSNTSINLYLDCSLCYRLHYIDGIRPLRQKSALLFGSALDSALNHLLVHKDLKQAIEVFENKWIEVDYSKTDFSKSDLDLDLLHHFRKELIIPMEPSYMSLLFKGRLFVECYYNNILPKIKKVIAVQEPVNLKNADGDEIVGTLDLIVEWEDGKTYLMDNKSSSVKYAPDSAKTGQQLPLYYYIVKDKYKLDGVGYIVLSKKINKNKVKTCKKCNTINTSSHKTCPVTYDEPVGDSENGIKVKSKKCGGEFNITINPSVDYDIIINQVDEEDEKRVIETFDQVNDDIRNGRFSETHRQEKNKFFQYCPYHDYYEGNPDFYKIERKEK